MGILLICDNISTCLWNEGSAGMSPGHSVAPLKILSLLQECFGGPRNMSV